MFIKFLYCIVTYPRQVFMSWLLSMFVSSRLRFCRCSQKLKGALYSFNLGVTCGVRNREEERRGFVYFLTKKKKLKPLRAGVGFCPPSPMQGKGGQLIGLDSPCYFEILKHALLRFYLRLYHAVGVRLFPTGWAPRVWGQQAPYPHLSRSFLFFCSNNIFLSYGYHVNSCSCEDVMKIKTILAPHT